MTTFFVVSRLCLIRISCLFPERAMLHPHPHAYLFMGMAEQQWLLLSLSPPKPPSNSCSCSNYPCLRLVLLGLISSVALNVVALWVLMTDWIGKWISYLGDAEWGEDGERKMGGKGDGRNTERLLERVTIISIS